MLRSGQGYFEWVSTTSNMNVKARFYYAGGTRVAVRTGSSTLNFLLGDHLGSTAITTDNLGARSAEVRYMPWGTTRWTYGTTPTTFLFTGQRRESSFGLYYYGARWSPGRPPGTGDPSLRPSYLRAGSGQAPAAGRFTQAERLLHRLIQVTLLPWKQSPSPLASIVN